MLEHQHQKRASVAGAGIGIRVYGNVDNAAHARVFMRLRPSMRGRSRATKLNGLLDDTHSQGAEMMGPCSIWRRSSSVNVMVTGSSLSLMNSRMVSSSRSIL